MRTRLLALALLLTAGCTPKPVEPPPGMRVPTVIVIGDSSGTLLPHADEFRDAVRRTVRDVPPDQLFNVFLPNQASGIRPLFAKPTLKVNLTEQAFEGYLSDSLPRGADAMTAAVTRALAEQPDVLWLISDGDVDDAAAIARMIQDARAERPLTVRWLPVAPDPDLKPAHNLPAALRSAGLLDGGPKPSTRPASR
jgi:hypothetical protein